MWKNDPHYKQLVIVPKMADVCKECGCHCQSCFNTNSLDLHHQIEDLRSKLLQSNNHIRQMEKDFESSRQYSDREINKLQEELIKLRDRYDRLYDSHRKFSKINQGLEDKLLTLVNKFEMERNALQKEIASSSAKVVEARVNISELEEDCERYRNDCNVAVQLLQCKPSNFVAHKLNTLPLDLQQRLKPHMTREEIIELEDSPPEQKMIRVPMPTFPPTAMVYSINKYNTVQIETKSNSDSSVPMTLIAKVLTPPERKRKTRRTYICNSCKIDYSSTDKEVQTLRRKDSDADDCSIGSHSSVNSYIHKPQRPRLNSTETEI